MMLRQIMFARVANNKDNHSVLVQIARDLKRCREVSAAGTTTENSLDAAQLARHFKRLPIRDVDNLVHILDVHVWWHNFLTNAFHEVRRGLYHFSSFLISLEN